MLTCRDRARMHTPRAPPQHGGRGRPGAVAGDRREGAREGASGSYPRGMAGRRRAMWPELATSAAARGRRRGPGATGGGGGGVEEGGDGEERRRGAVAAATGNFGSTSPR